LAEDMISSNRLPAGIFPNFDCCMKTFTAIMNTITTVTMNNIMLFFFFKDVQILGMF